MEHEPLVQGNYYHIFNRGNNRCNLFEQPAEYEHFLWLYDKYISPVADTLAWALMRNHFHLLVYIKKDVSYKYSIETLNRISPDKIWVEEHKWETISLSELSENLFDADRSKDAVRSEERFDVDFDLSACVAPDNVKMMEDNVKSKEDNVKIEIGNLKTPIPYRHFSHLFNAYSRYLQTRNGRTGNLFERPFKRKQIDNEEYLKTVVLYIHNNPVHHGFCNHTMEYPWTSYLTGISEKPTKLKRVEIIQLFNGKENFKQQHNYEIDIAPIEKWLEIAPSDLHDFDFDLSACAAPDNVKMEMDKNVKLKIVDEFEIDADRSIDAVRSEERTTVDFDLSACAAPDNVKLIKDDETKNND
jgi:putative transposase